MQWWSDYLDWRGEFEKAMDPRLYDIAYLDNRIMNGSARLWADADAAIVAELRKYPGGALTVHGLVAAGELDAIRRLIPLAEQWGQEAGAIGAEIESRIGWKRALQGDGYEPMQLKLWKDLV